MRGIPCLRLKLPSESWGWRFTTRAAGPQTFSRSPWTDSIPLERDSMRKTLGVSLTALTLLFGGAGVAQATTLSGPMPSSTTTTIAARYRRRRQRQHRLVGSCRPVRPARSRRSEAPQRPRRHGGHHGTRSQRSARLTTNGYRPRVAAQAPGGAAAPKNRRTTHFRVVDLTLRGDR